MKQDKKTINADLTRSRRDRGSALVLAIFVLVLLAGMGSALLFLTQNEMKMSQANLRVKSSFYLAEAAIEDGRLTLFATNGVGLFDDDLAAAAGPDDTINYDIDALTPIWDSSGNVTGFTGFGDDVPLRALTSFGVSSSAGWYGAFLTNDPGDAGGITAKTDSNNRVMITGIAAGADRSVEIVQAIIERRQPIEVLPPAAITLIGPSPFFDNGTSNAQAHNGNDCDGAGVPGLYMPIVGTIGSGAQAGVQGMMNRPENFESGPETGTTTVADLSDPLDTMLAGGGHDVVDTDWTNCDSLRNLLDDLAFHADYYCKPGSCSIPATSPNSLLFLDGDLTVGPGSYYGILVVTGTLTVNGNASWEGVILAVGEGVVDRSGGGGGEISGALIVADIAGPDNVYGTVDDCTPGDGFDSVDYHVSGGGNSEVYYCTEDINAANSIRPYEIEEFLQR